MLEAYLKVLDLTFFEVQEAFKGLADENVWKRPADGLLSVGELAGHIAYWEAVRFAGEGMNEAGHPDLSKVKVTSSLIDHRFAYHPMTLGNPPAEQHLAMTAEQVRSELIRVHEESIAHFKALNPDLASHPPGWAAFWTYEEFLKY